MKSTRMVSTVSLGLTMFALAMLVPEAAWALAPNPTFPVLSQALIAIVSFVQTVVLPAIAVLAIVSGSLAYATGGPNDYAIRQFSHIAFGIGIAAGATTLLSLFGLTVGATF